MGRDGFCSNGTHDIPEYQTSRQQTFDDCDEEVGGSKGDHPHWIDTSAMLADCLAKTMTSGRLNEMMSTGIFVIRPTEESLAMKAKNRKWRASKKEQEWPQDSDT